MMRPSSQREQQVANMLLNGAANSEIAHELNMSVRTVKAYMNRLFIRYEIGRGGIRRVRLVVKMYREQMSKEGADATR